MTRLALGICVEFLKIAYEAALSQPGFDCRKDNIAEPVIKKIQEYVDREVRAYVLDSVFPCWK